MRDWLNIRAKPIAILTSVGLMAMAGLLSLSTQKGETQGGRNSREEMKTAGLTVKYTRERTYNYNWSNGSHTTTRAEVERENLDAFILFEFPEGTHQMEEAVCEGLETQIRQLKKEFGQQFAKLKKEFGQQFAKEIREMEKAARECRQDIPQYVFRWDSWDSESHGSSSDPGPIRLVSFSSQAEYFLKAEGLEKGVELCSIAKPYKSYEHTYVKTVQGTDTLVTPMGRPIPPLPLFPYLSSYAIFAVGVKGDKLTNLVVGSHFFKATGSETTTHKGCESSTDKRPAEELVYLNMGFPVTHMGPDPEWLVQVQHTATGYMGSAKYRKTITDEGGTTVETKTITFAFDIGEAIYEVIVEPPKNLKDWVPKGGENENTPGDQLKFTGKVQEKKGSKSSGGSRKVKVVFELTSSREPGIAMNFPPKAQVSKPPRPDLRILKEGTSSAFKITEETREDGLGEYKAEGEFKVGESFTLVVGSFDYGAYGYLNVSADAPVRIEGYPDTNRVWLPRDDNMNSIADAWEKGKEFEGKASDSDEDSKPEGDGTPGDGLSLYEEYRGFMVQGNHIRTNPKYKDLFIFDLNKMGPGHFKKSGLPLHFVKLSEFYEDPESETNNTAVINFNHGHSNLGKQHLLFLMEGDGMGRTGYSYGGGPPKTIEYVLVDLNAHKGLPKEELSASIAHELAHASNVGHHGNCDYDVEKVELQDPNGRWITVSFGNHTIGVRGSQNSGPLCIMKYNDANYYEKPDGRYRWEKQGEGFRYGERYPPGEPIGNVFCNTKKGTVVTGDATYGECKKQFCVNDTRPCRKTPDFECK